MKTNNYFRSLALGCVALGAWAWLALPASAQTFSVLHSFTNSPDGADPQAGLTLSGNVLYGTTFFGGISNVGTVFQVNTDGTGYTLLKQFTNSADEANPTASLTLSGNVLYGTTEGNTGWGGSGAVFKVNTDGTGYTMLKNFTFVDGALPCAGLTLSSNVLYGTTETGGWGNRIPPRPYRFIGGTVFKINTDGTGFTMLKSFTNSVDEAWPVAGLTLSGNVLYGTTWGDGMDGGLGGAVFKINTDGTGYTLLRRFTNSLDGKQPVAGLTLSGNVLYGTTSRGGSSAWGTVFKINTDGTGYAVLKNFTNSPDGSSPSGGLTLSGNVLYGTTMTGGSSGRGTVFQINTDGTGYSVLKTFSTNSSPNLTNSDGVQPYFAGLTLSGNVLYGTASGGGGSGKGTVFALPLVAPTITSPPQNQTVVVSNAASFSVSAAGTDPLSYQWYSQSNGVAASAMILPGQTSNVLSLAAVTGTNVGNYFVVITNNYGSVTSILASLTVVLPGYNQISSPVVSGDMVSLSFVGVGGGNYALDRSFSLAPANWIPQVTNPADGNGNVIFTNAPDASTNNFWRIRSVP